MDQIFQSLLDMITAQQQKLATIAEKLNQIESIGGDTYTKSEIDVLLGDKVDKVSGMGLSEEDYTSTEKSKLSGIADNANNYSLPTATNSTLGGVMVDTALDSSSTNPVQNKVIAGAIGDINTVLENVL